MTTPEPSDPAAEAPRPAPQYGEYATPEQQRAAIREPAPAAPAAGEVPVVGVAPGGARAGRVDVGGAATPPRGGAAASAQPGRTVDRILTFGMLAYGLVTVISAIGQLWDFSAFAQSWLQLAGVDATFTNTAQGDLWGRIGAVAFAVGWLLTAAFAWRAVRRGRWGWWIPLVGAVVTFVVVSVCLTVPLVGDPAVVGHFGV